MLTMNTADDDSDVPESEDGDDIAAGEPVEGVSFYDLLILILYDQLFQVFKHSV